MQTDQDGTAGEQVTTADIRWREDGQPLSQQYDDVYFSSADGLKESEYVFIEGNRLTERWQTYDCEKPFTIGETGFGTGLNFLLAWRRWLDVRFNHNTDPSAKKNYLHFFSVEKYPLSHKDLEKALSLWPALSDQARKLINAYPPQPTAGFHRLIFDDHKVVLTLFIGNAVEGFTQSLPVSEIKDGTAGFGTFKPVVDAWFLDGFAPAKNPEMWQPKLFEAIGRHSDAATTFATFTVAGVVKRGLSSCGFAINKRKGFAHKREMLVGEMLENPINRRDSADVAIQPQTQTSENIAAKKRQRQKHPNTSWHLINHKQQPIRHCAVIGGGLAGCNTAFALAQKGLKVTLIEQQQTLAQGASGNSQGIVYAKLSPHSDVLSTYNLMALIYALHFYGRHSLFDKAGSQCGVLMQATEMRSETHYRVLAERYAADQRFIQWRDPQQSSLLAGVTLTKPCIYLPRAGWISPPQLCEALCQHPSIQVLVNRKVSAIKRVKDGWVLESDAHTEIHADALVLANANDIMRFQQTRELPLKSIRGQITQLPREVINSPLRTVICGDGYVAPSNDGFFTFGASYNLKEKASHLREEEQLTNLTKLAQLSPDLSLNCDSPPLSGRVGFRCTTPDYLPLAGPVPDVEAQKQRFSALRHNANAIIDAPGAFHENLFCLVGLGSRGLSYAPLAAEMLASMVTGDLLPLGHHMARHLNPSRFIIRSLIKNKR